MSDLGTSGLDEALAKLNALAESQNSDPSLAMNGVHNENESSEKEGEQLSLAINELLNAADSSSDSSRLSGSLRDLSVEGLRVDPEVYAHSRGVSLEEKDHVRYFPDETFRDLSCQVSIIYSETGSNDSEYFTLYHIFVSTPVMGWIVPRRYSEFHALHKSVSLTDQCCSVYLDIVNSW
jgi:hypothetical protein